MGRLPVTAFVSIEMATDLPRCMIEMRCTNTGDHVGAVDAADPIRTAADCVAVQLAQFLPFCAIMPTACVDGFVRSPDDLVSAVVWISDLCGFEQWASAAA
jgi:hypothetical protein